jgi:hypothetical protein
MKTKRYKKLSTACTRARAHTHTHTTQVNMIHQLQMCTLKKYKEGTWNRSIMQVLHKRFSWSIYKIHQFIYWQNQQSCLSTTLFKPKILNRSKHYIGLYTVLTYRTSQNYKTKKLSKQTPIQNQWAYVCNKKDIQSYFKHINCDETF